MFLFADQEAIQTNAAVKRDSPSDPGEILSPAKVPKRVLQGKDYKISRLRKKKEKKKD